MAKNWWPNVPRCLNEQRVVISSGIRVQSQPLALKKFNEYVFHRCRPEDVSRSDKDDSPSIFGKPWQHDLSNRLHAQIGGFPKLSVPAGMKDVLAQITFQAGYGWKVNRDVVFTHLRKGLRQVLKQCFWYGTCREELEYILTGRRLQLKPQILRLFFSPIRGLNMGLKKMHLR